MGEWVVYAKEKNAIMGGASADMISGILADWAFSIAGFHKLSRAFGKSIGFTIGMVLFPGICVEVS